MVQSGEKTLEQILAQMGTGALPSGVSAQFALINVSSSGNNTLVAAVTAKKIRVLTITLIVGAAVTMTFQSGAGGSALSGAMELAANGGFAPGFSPVGQFETAAGALLNLNLSTGVNVDGWLVYIEV